MVLCLKTPLLVPGDDIVSVARSALEAAEIQIGTDDVLAICESPLAITQGRIVLGDDLEPGRAARVFCRLFDQHGPMSTPYAMQVAIDLVGLPRITIAVAGGLLGRLLGRRGDFYRLAGRQVACIDDFTGTMPPWTQDIVLGPADPTGVACRAARALGCGVAVVDANDLGRVEILGSSPGIDRYLILRALCTNPQGNDDEQTPLVLVRPRK